MPKRLNTRKSEEIKGGGKDPKLTKKRDENMIKKIVTNSHNPPFSSKLLITLISRMRPAHNPHSRLKSKRV